jgi:hypothetical protein
MQKYKEKHNYQIGLKNSMLKYLSKNLKKV